MVEYENQCCDCATPSYPCIGSACPRRRVAVYRCDKCKGELDDIYEVDDGEYSEDCLKDMFRKEDEGK